MRITRTAAVTVAVGLVSAAVAVAAVQPTGTYKGNVHFKDYGGHKVSFALTATFTHGKLSELSGLGHEMPFNPKLSTSTFCGAANTFDFKSGIKGSLSKNGSFAYTVKDAYHDTAWLTGTFASSTKATGSFRYRTTNLPGGKNGGKGTCDSGELSVTLKR